MLGVVLVTGACDKQNGSTTTPTTTTASTAALWDPCSIGSEVWTRTGVDPSTVSSTIAGTDRVDGWKHCGGHDKPWTYSVDVWSTTHTIDDYRKRQDYTDFVPITVAGRDGFRYRQTSDSSGDKCDIVFPTSGGAAEVSVLRQDSKATVTPCDRAIAVATVVVPLMPR